jgi:hypothetical protein
MFGDLMQKIFRHAAVAERPVDARVPSAPPPPGTHAATAAAAAPGATAAGAKIDVESILTNLATAHHEKLDWRHSIVDLMKLVGMDSSITARKELAADLHYTGDTSDSASMNIWLHKEVMKKLAENGGHVPASLLAH